MTPLMLVFKSKLNSFLIEPDSKTISRSLRPFYLILNRTLLKNFVGHYKKMFALNILSVQCYPYVRNK